jgi:damage-control phosphatase, subfamily I
MRMHVDCFPCYFRQAQQAGEFSTGDRALQWKAVCKLADFLSRLPAEADPTRTAEDIHRVIREALGDPDPYKKVKEEYTEKAEAMLPLIDTLAASGADSLLTAVRIAIAGNIIDFGAGGAFDVESAIRGALDCRFAIDHYAAFRAAFERAKTVLYIGDNTGEIYFDIPLLRLLGGREVTFVTRGGPVLNDATIEYARRAGLDRYARLADTGSQSPGFPVERVRPEVRELFNSVDLVIAKGQANFESLHAAARPGLFMLLKTKCNLVARVLQVEFGDILLIESGRVVLNED